MMMVLVLISPEADIIVVTPGLPRVCLLTRQCGPRPQSALHTVPVIPTNPFREVETKHGMQQYNPLFTPSQASLPLTV